MTDDLAALQKDHGVLIFGFLPHGSDGIPVDKLHGERHRRLQSKNLGKTSRAHNTKLAYFFVKHKTTSTISIDFWSKTKSHVPLL